MLTPTGTGTLAVNAPWLSAATVKLTPFGALTVTLSPARNPLAARGRELPGVVPVSERFSCTGSAWIGAHGQIRPPATVCRLRTVLFVSVATLAVSRLTIVAALQPSSLRVASESIQCRSADHTMYTLPEEVSRMSVPLGSCRADAVMVAGAACTGRPSKPGRKSRVRMATAAIRSTVRRLDLACKIGVDMESSS